MGARAEGLGSGHVWTSDEVAAALGLPAPKKLTFKTITTDTRTPSPESRE